MNPYQTFGPGTFALIERKLARREFIDGEELALVLRNNPDAVLPAAIRDYLIRWLEGRVKVPRGRKPLGLKGEFRDLLARAHYERYYPWLERRRDRLGLNGWALIQNAEWWQGPPHERAARMVTRKLFSNHDWRSVLNIISARR